MPVINMPPNPPPVEPAPRLLQAQLTGTAYKTNLVDLKEYNYADLLTHIGGASWTVDYYSQVIAGNDELSAFQPNQLSIYQQYLKIHKYELKLQGALNTSFSDTNQQAEVTGSAITYPYLKPNAGDAFMADVGDGRTGLFTITKASPKSIMQLTCYEIEFILSRYVDKELVENIAAKVVKEAWYVRDFMTYGQYPILAQEEVVRLTRIREYHPQILSKWTAGAFSRAVRTTLVSGQPDAVYDPFLTTAIYRFVEIDENPILTRMRRLNCDDFELTQYLSLWDALIARDPILLKQAFTQAQCMPAQTFVRSRFMNGVAFSGVGLVVVPADGAPETDIAIGYIAPLSGISLTTTSICPEDVSPPAALSYPVCCANGMYVLSQQFYNGNMIGLTAFEILVWDYLKGNAINTAQLFAFCDTCYEWPPLERYYYLPILLILLRSAERNI